MSFSDPDAPETNSHGRTPLNTPDDGSRKAGIRILLVEDEFLVGFLLEDDLRAAGFIPIGPFTTLGQALEASRREEFDLAILDINLQGEMVYPLADDLSARQIPFIFLSGYASLNLPERFRAWPRLSKPHSQARLIAEIQRIWPGAG
jgi:DNA-binding response OmpR family regulator